MSLPQTNATLTSVTAPAASEDFEQDPVGGAEKWAGTRAVYFSERSQRVAEGGATTIVVTRAVIIPGDLPVAWAQGDTLTLIYRGQPLTGEVRGVERHEIPNAPATVRLTFEDS